MLYLEKTLTLLVYPLDLSLLLAIGSGLVLWRDYRRMGWREGVEDTYRWFQQNCKAIRQ